MSVKIQEFSVEGRVYDVEEFNDGSNYTVGFPPWINDFFCLSDAGNNALC